MTTGICRVIVVVLEDAATLEAIHAGHHDVQQDQVGLPVAGPFDRLEPVARAGDLIVFGRKLGLQQARVGGDVVNDEDARCHDRMDSSHAPGYDGLSFDGVRLHIIW